MINITLIDNGTSFINDFKKLLDGYNLNVTSWDGNYSSIESDIVILSGGHSHSIVNHKDHYKNELDFIKNNKIPLIGICLGAELLAYAFGSKLERLSKKELGILKIDVIKKDNTFVDLNTLDVYESHKWSITELGADLIGLAKSKDGFEIIKHKNLPFYGLQFHPEMVVDENNGKVIFTNILQELIGSKSH
jgi:GMP synthase (glutamine-hydrolysing)